MFNYLWHPDTGMIESTDYKIEDGYTTMRLRLDRYGSIFIVFRHAAIAPERTLPKPVSTVLAVLEGPWNVNFPPNWGAPSQIGLDNLISWTASADPGVKYFSGTATYSKEVEASPEWFRSESRVVIDLGTVREIAEILVNGKKAGPILWKPPFQADITQALKPGTNLLEIKITNLWPNRIIGDQQPGTEKKYTFTDFRPYKADSSLLESGLLGPVTIRSELDR
jgi:hypothetical protein